MNLDKGVSICRVNKWLTEGNVDEVVLMCLFLTEIKGWKMQWKDLRKFLNPSMHIDVEKLK